MTERRFCLEFQKNFVFFVVVVFFKWSTTELYSRTQGEPQWLFLIQLQEFSVFWNLSPAGLWLHVKVKLLIKIYLPDLHNELLQNLPGP